MITSYFWEFGDGSTSSESSPAYTYEDPGVFDVALTVTGPGGSDTLVQPGLVEVLPPELKIEVGELTLTHELQRVDFTQQFFDPIVILGPPSGIGGDPVTVRLNSVDAEGFWVQLQEWEYSDGPHTAELVGYVVLERGVRQLPDGSWIEAGQIEVDGDGVWELGLFDAPFSSAPVVLASVATVNGTNAVTTRLRDIDVAGFEALLQAQEASSGSPAAETMNYLAWEPSCGEVAGLRFAAGATADDRTHSPSSVDFSDPCIDTETQADQAPVLIADMQTADGLDTATLRWLDKTTATVTVWIEEEQSLDSETAHTTESLGYLAIGPASDGDP
jgi:PKD repeat protein